MKESCTVYSLIFMIEMLKEERTTHIAMHSALSIHLYILVFVASFFAPFLTVRKIATDLTAFDPPADFHISQEAAKL